MTDTEQASQKTYYFDPRTIDPAVFNWLYHVRKVVKEKSRIDYSKYLLKLPPKLKKYVEEREGVLSFSGRMKQNFKVQDALLELIDDPDDLIRLISSGAWTSPQVQNRLINAVPQHDGELAIGIITGKYTPQLFDKYGNEIVLASSYSPDEISKLLEREDFESIEDVIDYLSIIPVLSGNRYDSDINEIARIASQTQRAILLQHVTKNVPKNYANQLITYLSNENDDLAQAILNDLDSLVLLELAEYASIYSRIQEKIAVAIDHYHETVFTADHEIIDIPVANFLSFNLKLASLNKATSRIFTPVDMERVRTWALQRGLSAESEAQYFGFETMSPERLREYIATADPKTIDITMACKLYDYLNGDIDELSKKILLGVQHPDWAEDNRKNFETFGDIALLNDSSLSDTRTVRNIIKRAASSGVRSMELHDVNDPMFLLFAEDGKYFLDEGVFPPTFTFKGEVADRIAEQTLKVLKDTTSNIVNPEIEGVKASKRLNVFLDSIESGKLELTNVVLITQRSIFNTNVLSYMPEATEVPAPNVDR